MRTILSIPVLTLATILSLMGCGRIADPFVFVGTWESADTQYRITFRPDTTYILREKTGTAYLDIQEGRFSNGGGVLSLYQCARDQSENNNCVLIPQVPPTYASYTVNQSQLTLLGQTWSRQ